jgi:hypothetical protein
LARVVTLGLGLALAALALIAVTALVAGDGSNPANPVRTELFQLGGSGSVGLGGLLRRNLMVLGLTLLLPAVGARAVSRAPAAGTSRPLGEWMLGAVGVRLRPASERPPRDRGAVALRAVTAGTIIAGLGHVLTLGRQLPEIAGALQMSPLSFLSVCVHGPFEFWALMLPLALLLRCQSSERREALPRLLGPVSVAALALMGFLAFGRRGRLR